MEGKKFSTSRNHAIWADEFLAAQDPELVRLFLSWDRPDFDETDFRHEAYEAFCAWVGPLLKGERAAGPLPEPLVAAELRRAERALQLIGFDPPLSVRSLLGALGAGAGHDSSALAALAGRPPVHGR